jgi:aldehyde dehydrogenase family 7 member A1
VHVTVGSDLLTLRVHLNDPQGFPLFCTMLLARRTLGKFSTPPLSRRRLSSRASAVLSALDIPTTPSELPGVYDGEWKGSGEVFQSVCPATGEVLAHVKSVSYNI